MELREIVEEIKTKTVVEINELVKMLEEEFGVSAAAAVVAGPVAGAGAAAGDARSHAGSYRSGLDAGLT